MGPVRKRGTPVRKQRRAGWPFGSAAGAPAGSSGTRPGHFHAFRVGLAGTLGVGVGLVVWAAVSSLATLIVYVGLAAFVALGLDPVVKGLEGRKVPRPLAVVLVIAAMGLSGAGLLYWIIPRLVAEIRALIAYLPVLVERILRLDWVENMAATLSVYLNLDELAAAMTGFLSDPENLTTLGGGPFPSARDSWVASPERSSCSSSPYTSQRPWPGRRGRPTVWCPQASGQPLSISQKAPQNRSAAIWSAILFLP